MGLFDSIAKGFRDITGGVDQELLATGELGRGEIVGLSLSGTTVTVGNGLVERNCTFQLNVILDLQPPFQASVNQRVQEINLPQLQQPGVTVAVRVDPADHSRVAIDFATQPPEVRLPETTGPGSAASILETGKPIVVVLVANQPIGVKNFKGDPVHALTLTVAEGVETPYQVQVGNAVPASALPLLFPGSRLNAKLGDGPNEIVVDWAAGAAK
ncbi:MAG: hypothetical protein EPN91_02765 [Salinibacterium sp.]|nr:MAG: hypothetical protein EPN91_02765 [Salinibacterium sp.]